MSEIANRLKSLFELVEYHAISLSGFKLLRAVVKESGFATTVVVRAIEHGKKTLSKYSITPEAVSDSTALDLQYISTK